MRTPKSGGRAETHPEIRGLLKESGLKCTLAREAILTLLHAARRPLAHGEITRERGVRGLDRVTVYRTLTALQEAGLLHRTQDNNGVWRFGAHPRHQVGCPGNHPHFVCTSCGVMRCLSDQALPWITVAPGEQVVGKQMVAYGLCSGCASS
jgi:Fur family transcriptional regulator, ferric uptake regulator